MLRGVILRAGKTSGSGPVSPSVIATEMCAIDAEGHGTLELLVLWRGSPGWFKRGGDGGGSGGGGSTLPAGRAEVRTEWLSQGGVSLSVRFEPASRKVWIGNQEIDLNDANVVLVDDVDAEAGLRVAGVLRIDPAFEPQPAPVPVQRFIRRSPELVDYLRCDVRPPDLQPYENQVFDMWCAAVRQP
jgi:hypothetical protein